MEINWFTVVAQLINFFLLVWLLKRFLYKPILTAIDEREDKIAAQLEDAEGKKAAAEKEQKDLTQKNLVFDQDREKLMGKAVSEAAEEREKLLGNARTEAEHLVDKLTLLAKDQRKNERKDRQQKIQQEVFAVARETLTSLADADLEEQLVKAFIKRLKSLQAAELKALKAAFANASDTLKVRSALAFSDKQQKALKQAVDEALTADSSLTFEVKPGLIGGMELSTHEYKLAWSISEYLRAFEESVPPANGKQAVSLKQKKHHA